MILARQHFRCASLSEFETRSFFVSLATEVIESKVFNNFTISNELLTIFLRTRIGKYCHGIFSRKKLYKTSMIVTPSKYKQAIL